MTIAAEGNPPFSVLLQLLDLPDLPPAEVLLRLGPAALASLAGAGRGFRAAVEATALMQWAKDENDLPPRPFIFGDASAPPLLCVREACSLAARGGHLEVLK